MALEVDRGVPVGVTGTVEMWTADRRLALTEDKSRVVPEESPAARWLWCTPGNRVPMAEAIRLGAVADEAPAAEKAEPKAKADPESAGDAESEDKPKLAAKRAATKADAS